MRRRSFLSIASTGALSALALAQSVSAQMGSMPGGGMGAMMGRLPPSRSRLPTGLPLPHLGILENQSAVLGDFEGTLVASPYNASLVSDRTTELWGYNGQYPGPVIELREGQRVAITFANRLDLESTIHWHGLAVPAEQDGSPMDPVEPYADRLYTFEVPIGSAGTYWYHPHAHETNTLQVGHGLAAPLIVRGSDDPLQGLSEQTLMITSLGLDSNAQVITGSTSMSGMGAMMMSGIGELLVNGRKLPVYTVTPGATERWRIINATADRYLRLSLDGHYFAVVGTDGGLLDQPLPGLSEWLLAPAQRVEIVVSMNTRRSTRYTLRDLGYGGGMNGSSDSELMTVQTSGAVALAPIELPRILRPIIELGPATVQQQVVLSGAGMGMTGAFLINGRRFDMDRVDLETVVGRVELWEIVNASFMDHPIHIHGTQFQVVGRTVRGVPIAAALPGWFDTVNVPAGETVTIKTQQMLPGKRMFHCHLLPHEDAGMMAVLDVRTAAS